VQKHPRGKDLYDWHVDEVVADVRESGRLQQQAIVVRGKPVDSYYVGGFHLQHQGFQMLIQGGSVLQKSFKAVIREFDI